MSSENWEDYGDSCCLKSPCYFRTYSLLDPLLYPTWMKMSKKWISHLCFKIQLLLNPQTTHWIASLWTYPWKYVYLLSWRILWCMHAMVFDFPTDFEYQHQSRGFYQWDHIPHDLNIFLMDEQIKQFNKTVERKSPMYVGSVLKFSTINTKLHVSKIFHYSYKTTPNVRQKKEAQLQLQQQLKKRFVCFFSCILKFLVCKKDNDNCHLFFCSI